VAAEAGKVAAESYALASEEGKEGMDDFHKYLPIHNLDKNIIKCSIRIKINK
jgi:hypothetical protein